MKKELTDAEIDSNAGYHFITSPSPAPGKEYLIGLRIMWNVTGNPLHRLQIGHLDLYTYGLALDTAYAALQPEWDRESVLAIARTMIRAYLLTLARQKIRLKIAPEESLSHDPTPPGQVTSLVKLHQQLKYSKINKDRKKVLKRVDFRTIKDPLERAKVRIKTPGSGPCTHVELKALGKHIFPVTKKQKAKLAET